MLVPDRSDVQQTNFDRTTQCALTGSPLRLLSCRDNHRISMHDAGLAEQLWRVAGLERVMQGVEVDGLLPVGLNPHIRFYRWDQLPSYGLFHMPVGRGGLW